jgi:hypothetical protein
MSYGPHVSAQNITANTSFLSKESQPQRKIIRKGDRKTKYQQRMEGNK